METKQIHVATRFFHVAKLRGDVAKLRCDMEMFRGDMEKLFGDIAKHLGDMEMFRSDLAKLRGDMEKLFGDMEKLVGDIARLRGGMEMFRSDLAKFLGDTKNSLATSPHGFATRKNPATISPGSGVSPENLFRLDLGSCSRRFSFAAFLLACHRRGTSFTSGEASFESAFWIKTSSLPQRATTSILDQ